jgi:hypothetical protein
MPTDQERDRHWPRDAPIRWDRFAGVVAYQAVAVLAFAAHLVLGFVLLFRLRAEAVDWLIALAWGALALFAVWSWWFHRWRIVAAPIVVVGLALLTGRGLVS